MTYNKELIEVLSKEVLKYSELIMTFRTRIAFYSWIGPFIILGSFVVATEGRLPSTSFNELSFLPIIIGIVGLIVGCYLGIAKVATNIEKQAWSQCNRVREIMTKLATDEDYLVTIDEYRDDITNGLQSAYMWAYGLIIISALTIVGLLFILGMGTAN